VVIEAQAGARKASTSTFTFNLLVEYLEGLIDVVVS